MMLVRISARLLENEINERTNRKEYRGRFQWEWHHTTLEAGIADDGTNYRWPIRSTTQMISLEGNPARTKELFCRLIDGMPGIVCKNIGNGLASWLLLRVLSWKVNNEARYKSDIGLREVETWYYTVVEEWSVAQSLMEWFPRVDWCTRCC